MGMWSRHVKVTVTVEVARGDGTVETSVTDVRLEDCGNPAFTTRVAHRTTEAISDVQRKMLGSRYGELDPEWRADERSVHPTTV